MKTKLSTLEKKLDKVFSEYIKIRDIDKPCCSCGEFKQHKDCGHWYSRRHKTIRWDEMNAHGQCIRCNRFDPDQGIGYFKFMIDTYGMEEMSELTDRKNGEYHKDSEILERLIKRYKFRITRLKKEKGL